jgi:hypothetical protein
MATPERMPLANPTLRNLAKVRARGAEYDFLALQTRDYVKYHNDFIGGAITLWPEIVGTGGGGTAAATALLAGNGALTLATSAGDNAASLIYLAEANWIGDKNPVMTVGFLISSVASGNMQVGFCDNIAAGVLTTTGVGPFVSPLASPPTLVSTTANAIALTYDLSSALAYKANWSLAYSRASTAALVAGTAAATTTYQTLTIALQRIDLATDQMAARAYVNGVLVASVATAAISNTAPLYPFVLIGATSGTERTCTLDYLDVYQQRSPLLFG